MSFFEKVLSAGKRAAGVQYIFDKMVRTFHIALIGLSPDWNGFMRRSEGKLNMRGLFSGFLEKSLRPAPFFSCQRFLHFLTVFTVV